MMVVFPAPVAPTNATRWPGSIAKETSRRTGSPSTYSNVTCSNAILPALARRGSAGVWISTGVSINAKIRSEEAMAACSTLNFSDMSLIGRKKRCEYSRNATSDPSVSVPLCTQPPPNQMMSDAASAPTSSTAG